MAEVHHLKVKIDGPSPRSPGVIELDGRPLHVSEVKIELGNDHLNKVILTLDAVAVDVELDSRVIVFDPVTGVPSTFYNWAEVLARVEELNAVPATVPAGQTAAVPEWVSDLGVPSPRSEMQEV